MALGLFGSGEDSGSGQTAVQFVVFEPGQLPATVGYALLEIDVVAVNDSQSAVGAFAIVVPQQKRPEREDVPVTASLRRVRLVERDMRGNDRLVRHRIETGKKARSLARAFDKLAVVRTGRPIPVCPAPRRRVTTVSFIARHHRWVATPFCGFAFIDVTRDGTEWLPNLSQGNHYVNLVNKDINSRRG